MNKMNLSIKEGLKYLVVALLGQVSILGNAVPIALPIIRRLCRDLKMYISMQIVALASVFWKFGIGDAVKYLVIAVLYYFVFEILESISLKNSLIKNTLVFITVFIGEFLFLLFDRILVYDVFTAILIASIVLIYEIITKETFDGLVEMDFVSNERILSLTVFSAFLILGLSEIELVGISISRILAILAILLASNIKLTAVAIGAIMGFAMLITEMSGIVEVARYTLSGLLACCFNKLGKIGGIIGFILANSLLSYYVSDSIAFISSLLEIVIAGSIFYAIPKDTLEKAEIIFVPPILMLEEKNSSSELAVAKIKESSEVFSEMGKRFNEEEEEEKIDDFLIDKLCGTCSNMENCYLKNSNMTIDALLKSFYKLETSGELTETDIIENFEYSPCIKSDELIKNIEALYNKKKIKDEVKKQNKYAKKLVKKQFVQFSNIVQDIVKSATEVVQNSMDYSKNKINIVVSSVREKKFGSIMSGDNLLINEDLQGRSLIILCDGMGSGEEAYRTSLNMVESINDMARIGIEKERAIDIANLFSIYNSEEESVSIDIADIDLKKGRVEFIKAGAAASFIKHKDYVEMIQAKTLPAGILDEVDIGRATSKLEKNDFIIMISDGVSDSRGELKEKNQWIKEFLENGEWINPEDIASELKEKAIENYGGKAKDDISVIVAKAI